MARTKVIDTKEFEEAVAAKAAEVAEKILAEKLQGIVSGVPAPSVGVATQADGGVVDVLGEILSKLGMNMAAIANQGQRNKPLPPEEVARRAAAEERMGNLLIAAQRANDPDSKPTYKIISKIYLNERFIEPFLQLQDKKVVNNEITWTGAPNDAMQPLNDVAKEIFAAWRESTGGPTTLIPTADNRPLYVTAQGLTVRGDPPKRQTAVAGEHAFKDDLGFANNDPNAPEVAVLGTVAAKARQNTAGVNMAPRMGG